MKLKDFFCLLAGVALLALAFQIKGLTEETTPGDEMDVALQEEAEQGVMESASGQLLADCIQQELPDM